MARRGRHGRRQPHAGCEARRLPPRQAADARLAARPPRRIRAGAAVRAAAHVGRRVRVRRLRHHTARRAPARRAARRAARPRQHPDAPHRDGHFRCGEGRDHHRDAGAPQCAADAGSSLQGRLQAPEERRRGARQAAAAHAVDRRSQAARTQARIQHDTRPLQGDGATGQGVHRRRRHLPGRASPSASPPPSRCRRSRSIGRCAAPTPRPTSSISTSAASRSSDRARRSSCACATAR